MKVLVVGGTFDKEGGRMSGLVASVTRKLLSMKSVTGRIRNGGQYEELQGLLESAKDYDIVFWWPNVPDDLPKVRNVKEIAPHVMLVASTRNDDGKYTFQELVRRALALKANLMFEFQKQEDGLFRIKVFDPLGSLWYEGMDIHDALAAAMAPAIGHWNCFFDASHVIESP